MLLYTKVSTGALHGMLTVTPALHCWMMDPRLGVPNDAIVLYTVMELSSNIVRIIMYTCTVSNSSVGVIGYSSDACMVF